MIDIMPRWRSFNLYLGEPVPMTKCHQIAANILNFLANSHARKDFSIFLCGGASKEQYAFRRKLGSDITQIKSIYDYSVHFPEDIFLELLLGHAAKDLLSLETLLGESVDAVVIPLQSPGTFSELGAFSSHLLLKDKLIILMEEKYRLTNSFINQGPIRYLRNQTHSQVLYETLQIGNAPHIARRVAEMVRSVARDSPTRSLETFQLDNPLIAGLFYYLIVYVLQPLPRGLLIGEARAFKGATQRTPEIAEICINGLLTKGDIVLSHDNNLKINPSKTQGYLQSKSITESRRRMLTKFLTAQRIEAMNYFFRKNRGLTYKEGLR